LLDIPPFLFGLEQLKRTSYGLFNWERIDVQEYSSTLAKYSTGWHATTVFQAVSDVKQRIGNLYREAPHASEKQEMLKLLGGYLILLGDLAHSFMEFDSAIDHFEKAIAVAKEEKLYDLWTFALRQKGNVYEERGEITAGTQGYGAAKADFALAKGHIQVAQALEQKIQPVFSGLVLACASTAYAACAQDQSAPTHQTSSLRRGIGRLGGCSASLSFLSEHCLFPSFYLLASTPHHIIVREPICIRKHPDFSLLCTSRTHAHCDIIDRHL
jgi:hypothetical protein